MGQCASHSEKPKKGDGAFISKSSHRINDFKLLKLIGKGGFSRVWKAQEKKSGKIYALKVMSKAKIIAKRSVKAVLQERLILTKLMNQENNGIVNMLASFQDDGHLYILMDYLEGQSLRYRLSSGISLSNSQIRSLVYAILKSLEYLYKHSIVHRDIKPENILFNKQGQPFLTDFGIASYIDDHISDNNSGTLGYMAPEVIQSQSHSFTADYYAIGVITFQLFLKKRPFSNINKQQLLKQITKTHVDGQNFPELNQIPAEACDFIVKLLERKARTRLGYEGGICELLEHPWFSCMGFDSSDRIQLNFMKFPLGEEPQNNLSLILQQESVESANTQMNEQKITKILHRDHVQEMFRNFNSETSIEGIRHKRRMSASEEKLSTPYSLKRLTTNST